MLFASPAKVNLNLNVGARRADGYHDVESVFHLISLHDTLELTAAAAFGFSCDRDLGIPTDDNLIVKAARAMSELHARPLPDAHIHLTKRIPHGAGLGGGSSNAATTIYALSIFWGVRPNCPENLAVAAQLGSDVPLFLAPSAASVMRGRGEQLAQSLEPLAGLPLVVVYPPGVHSATGEVYRAFDAHPQLTCAQDALIAEMQRPSPQIAPLLFNNLEEAALAVSPLTKEILVWLRANPAVQAAMVAGSGSACWALCATLDTAQKLATDACAQGWWAQACSTATQGIGMLPDDMNPNE